VSFRKRVARISKAVYGAIALILTLTTSVKRRDVDEWDRIHETFYGAP
jgi:hypothetical protein